MGAQKFNFAPKLPQTGGFSAPKFVFERKFSEKMKIFRQAKLRGTDGV